MSVSHHIPQELKNSSYSLNSVIKARNASVFIPINGTNGYSPQKQEIEFQVSHKDLFDLTTLQLAFTSDVSFVDLASNVISVVEIYLADKLIERVENYNQIVETMTLASVNDSYYEHELNMMEGAHEFSKQGNAATAGDFIHNFSGLGISKIQQFLPLYHNNLRIVIRLENPAKCTTATTYNISNVKLMCDTVEPIQSYMDKLHAIVRSEAGLSFPIQTYDVKTRSYEPNMNFNLSYAELDSIFGIIKKPTSTLVDCGAPEVTGLSVNMNGKYLSMDAQGLDNKTKIYNAMRKSLALPHDVAGSTMMNRSVYDEMTLLGVDCEKILSPHHVFSSGLNTREMGYSLDWETTTSTALPANTKFLLVCLHRQLVKMSNNSVTVMK